MAYVNFGKLDMDKLTRETIQELTGKGNYQPSDEVYDILEAFVAVVRRLEGNGLAESGDSGGNRSRVRPVYRVDGDH